MATIVLLVLALFLALFGSLWSWLQIRRAARVARWRAQGATAVPVHRGDLLAERATRVD